MQRLFSSFPTGLPGVGLLLMRLGLAGRFLLYMDHDLTGQWNAVCLAGFASIACLLALGLVIPLAAILGTAAITLVISLERASASAQDLLVITMLLALALIGAGAYSVDARLYGRRTVVTPQR